MATGIIEGACRHLVKDRALPAPAWDYTVPKQLSNSGHPAPNGDFDTYWRYHLGQEQQRIHQSRYADNIIPQAA
jgi:hypothetical protein